MKVCLTNTPWEQGGRWGVRSGCRFPNLMPKKHNSYVPFPFLLAYTAAYLESHGIEVLTIDGVAERCTQESFLERVRRFAPDLLIAETATPSFEYDLALLSRLLQDLPAMKMVFYGPHVSVLPHEALCSPAVYAVLIGEPEQTSLELVQALANGEDLRKVDGLMFKDPQGTVITTRRRDLIADLASLPYPKRNGLPLREYHVPGFPEPVVFMYGSRGCPFQCSFCVWPQTLFRKGSYRARSGESLAQEMQWVLTNFPDTKSFFFDDDTFNLGRQRMHEFADALERRGINRPWGCNARADHWDRATLQRLRENGLFTLRIGIESGDQTILQNVGKALNLEEARTMLGMSHELGIQNHISIVIGLQGESQQSLANTLKFIQSVPVDSVQFSLAIPFPGTAYYDYVEEHGYFLTRDWAKFNGFDHVVMRTEHLTGDDIMKAIGSLRRRVYFSPRFVTNRLRYVRSLRDLGALSRKALRLVLHR
jgi:anaerobic magnesium-protoporphyrin IX monomethyl ester cyclase